MKLKPRVRRILLTVSCVCALVALVLMVWSVLDPRPVPVIVAMSVGQVIGTFSLLLYGVVVLLDIRHVIEEEEPKS
jgi:hypothetical protein